MAQEVTVDALLALAVIVVLASSLGVLLMRDVYQKLHYVTPAALVAPVLVALAVTVEVGWSADTTDSWLALLFVAATGPVLAHATARAARVREKGDWRGTGEAIVQGPVPATGGARGGRGRSPGKGSGPASRSRPSATGRSR